MNEFIKELYDSTVVKAGEGKLLQYNILRGIKNIDTKNILLTIALSAILFSPVGKFLVLLDIIGAISSYTTTIVKNIVKKIDKYKEQKEYSNEEKQEEPKNEVKTHELQKEDEIVKTIQPTYYKEQEPVESKHKVLVKKLR